MSSFAVPKAQAPARIYTVFTSEGLIGSSVNYPHDQPDQHIFSNAELLQLIAESCEGIEFLGTTQPISARQAPYVLANLAGQRKSLAGVLYFGTPPDSLVELGLPVLAVFPRWGQWMAPFAPRPGKRVAYAFLPVLKDKDPAVFEGRLQAIVEQLNLMKAIDQLKRLRVLLVTDVPRLGAYEPMPDQMPKGRAEYEETWFARLEEVFGSEFVIIPQAELVAKKDAQDTKEAEAVADKWLAEAADVKGTNREEVIKSARLYLAMKELMADYGCNAITTEGYGIFASYEGGIIPSQGLPSSQLCTDGVVATSETLADSLLTQQLGLYLTGSCGFNGDYVVDPPTQTVFLGHCECPFNPYGDERRAPYIIRNLPRLQPNTGGACVQVNLPVGETVTVVKLALYRKKMSLFTGETFDGNTLHVGWDDLLCRTKLAIRAKVDKLFERLDWPTFGVHRVAFFGDYRAQFRALGNLLGFEVVEKDLD